MTAAIAAVCTAPMRVPERGGGKLGCREIDSDDLAAIAALLQAGFPARPRAWFDHMLVQLAQRAPPPGCPRFGYMLEAAGRPVGAVLTIMSQRDDDISCNVACWYVQEKFSIYGTLLYQRLLQRRDVTLVNVTPARATWPVIEAQGFRRFAAGAFAGLPALSRWRGGARIADDPSPTQLRDILPEREAERLLIQAQHGCILLVCTIGGTAHPFVFRRRRFRRFAFPAAQLIFSRDIDGLARCAGPLGRHLVRRGMPWLFAAANGPLPGMPGIYLADRYPMYARGANPPAPHDLTDTELALFGA